MPRHLHREPLRNAPILWAPLSAGDRRKRNAGPQSLWPRVCPVSQCGWLCPWPLAAGASLSSGFSTTRVSVVSSMAAIDAAFCTADLVTFTGSMTPWATRSPYSPVAAL